MGLLFYLSVRKKAAIKLLNSLINLFERLPLARWQLERLREQMTKMLDSFLEATQILSERPKSLILLLFLSILAWLFDVLVAVSNHVIS